MRTKPAEPYDEYDQKELEELNAEPWMFDLLDFNPSYVSWGPHEDYMWKEGSSWDSRQVFSGWADFGPIELNELNECVNFYFEVSRSSVNCEACSQTGYNKETRQLDADWYAKNWRYELTQDEVDLLLERGRFRKHTHTFVTGEGWVEKDPPADTSAAAINAFNKTSTDFLSGMDAVDRYVCVKARAKRLGFYGFCPECEGNGYIFTSPAAHVNLILWWLHPRKGCSRGFEIQNIQQEDIPAVLKFLATAAERNADRFARVVAAAKGEVQ